MHRPLPLRGNHGVVATDKHTARNKIAAKHYYARVTSWIQLPLPPEHKASARNSSKTLSRNPTGLPPVLRLGLARYRQTRYGLEWN